MTPHQTRISKLQSYLRENSLDAILITNPINVFYLINVRGQDFHDPLGYLCVTPDTATFLTSPGNAGETHDIQGADAQFITPQTGGYQTALPKLLNVNKLAFEADYIKYSSHQKLQELLPQTQLIPTEELVLKHRLIKDQSEIDLIKQAQSLTDQAFTKLLKIITPGITERQLHQKLLNILVDLGSEEPAFTPIVASGSNATTIHARTTNKEILKDECILFDFGASVGGYKSDMSRTIFLGTPTEAFANHYQQVLQAQQSAIKSLQPGIAANNIHQVVSDTLGDNLQYMPHTTGHGVGIDIHEPPVLYTGIQTTLEPNMVITIEPGLYIPDHYGIRIEDLLLITTDGYQNLTTSAHELISL